MLGKGKERGLLSLEACVVVTMFMFLMLFIYSFFIVFEAQNELSHVILSATNSLSLDTYAAEKTLQSTNASTRLFLGGIYGTGGSFSSDFINYDAWYKSPVDGEGSSGGNFDGTIYASVDTQTEADRKAQEESDRNGLVNLQTRDADGNLTSAVNPKLEAAISERFIAYLSGGDRTRAEKILNRLHIKGGVDGLDFSLSYISSGNLNVVLKCEIEYEFNFFGLASLSVELRARSKLW